MASYNASMTLKRSVASRLDPCGPRADARRTAVVALLAPLWAVMLVGLAACGQKGPLNLPKPTARAAAAAPAPATSAPTSTTRAPAGSLPTPAPTR